MSDNEKKAESDEPIQVSVDWSNAEDVEPSERYERRLGGFHINFGECEVEEQDGERQIVPKNPDEIEVTWEDGGD